MGMFDSVLVDCPQCHSTIEFQSKAGECILATFSHFTAPFAILADLQNQSASCEKCGRVVALKIRPMQGMEGYVE
jgi:hypothetical protein